MYPEDMATKTANIALNEELDHFIRTDMETGGFSNVSEYFRDLVRRRRQQRAEEDAAYLEKSIRSAPAGEPSADFFDRADEIKHRHRQGK
ncbi:MAG: hypothetical protein HY300_11165 [Verrucomicrobia bacterium]|nr:hypothetical protein [Verrucomicrobiota bacterium]